MENLILPPPQIVGWNTGKPDVKEGGQNRFWCAVKPLGSEKLHHRVLLYCNRYAMPLSDQMLEAPKGCEPVPNSDEDYYWTGWFEESCDQCETQWTYSGEIVAWLALPRLKL